MWQYFLARVLRVSLTSLLPCEKTWPLHKSTATIKKQLVNG